ncbi:rhamnan synthesis F family protein [Nocardioides sp. B-3]|uniref:rhamnan synthesis F family protein n=1 Tax=Nocardioides sp. B-3 TaxID=2895565 RepID=UPI0021529EAE|nr:rhamnan synthesis F family protein [Nocardioides sp. B-3]UUZ60017.1 rhamnan synthesis F family protein [Nocardioides sp. B-3]
MLAKELVGWDVIDSYDELMLANDSCFSVQPLDRVFAKMDATTCDWWGLQATYDDFDDRAFQKLGRRLGLDEVGEQMRELSLWRYSDFIHVGSYFLCYRRRVHRDPRFRKRLDDVASQSEKVTIILKYEIGFSRLLIPAGFKLATFVDGIPAYHPVYRASAFDLMREGFPAAQAPAAHREPVRDARPAPVEGSRARGRARGRRGGDRPQPATDGTAVEPGPQLRLPHPP